MSTRIIFASGTVLEVADTIEDVEKIIDDREKKAQFKNPEGKKVRIRRSRVDALVEL